MNRTRIITSIALIIAMLMSSMVIAGDSYVEDASANPTRASGETLRINGTITIDKMTPQNERTYDSIIIEDEGSLIINGGTIIVKTIICKPTSKNTTFIMKNDGNIRSTLTVQGGFMDIRASEISLKQSTISVSNETGTLSKGENGHACSVTLISRSTSLLINDSSINLQAQAGGQGDSTNSGGRGGSSSLTLATEGENVLDVSGSTLEVFAGKGGDAFATGLLAGTGGEAFINMRSHHINIRDSMIHGESGDSGVAGSSSVGSATGNSRMEMESYDSNVIIDRTTIISRVGVSSGTQEVQSFIKMEAKLGSILWDEGKEDDERFQSLSTLEADTTQMEARDGSYLYQVDVGENEPRGFAGTDVDIFWWANVKIVDNTGSPMEGVAVRYFEPPYTTELFPVDGPVMTDSNGDAWLEVVSYHNDQTVRYTFTAEDLGGATGSSDQVRFTENMNEEVIITLTTITIDTPFKNDQLIGGTVRFVGTAESGGLNNVVNRVVIYIDDEVLGEAENTAPEGSIPFSSWLLVWDSTTVEDGEYLFSFVAFDNSYQATEPIKMRVDQESVPHPPILDLVEVTDPLGMTEVPAGGSVDVHVSQKDRFIDFRVIIFDIDYKSETLLKGKDLVSADYRLIYKSTGEEIVSRVIDEFQKKNESGGFYFDFQIDSSKKPGTSAALDDGVYVVEFDIYDDAEKWIDAQFIEFELFFDYYPNAYAFIDIVEGKRLDKDMVPQEDQFEDYEAFRLGTEESHTITVRFNLTRSTDQDSNKFGASQSYQDLTFTMRVRRKTDTGPEDIIFTGEKGLSSTEYTFDVEDVKGDGKTTGDFDVWFDVIDEDGLEDTVRYIVRITHDPPKEEHSILGEATGVDAFDIIPDNTMSIVYPLLFILFAIGVAGSMFLFFIKNNNDKKKKMDLIERKREQDRERAKDTSIDEEISGKYMNTSQKYLEKTGAGKGKDEFAKELEKASGNADDRPVTGSTVETLPTPGQTQPVKQQEPPTPDTAQPAVQPPKPAQSPAQAAVQPPKPAQPPVQQQPPASTPPVVQPPKPAQAPVPPAAPPVPQPPKQ